MQIPINGDSDHKLNYPYFRFRFLSQFIALMRHRGYISVNIDPHFSKHFSSQYYGFMWQTPMLTHLPLDKVAAIQADYIFKCIFFK